MCVFGGGGGGTYVFLKAILGMVFKYIYMFLFYIFRYMWNM